MRAAKTSWSVWTCAKRMRNDFARRFPGHISGWPGGGQHLARILLAAVLPGFLAIALPCPCLAGEAELAVASFWCDTTPPIGHPLCGGWIKPLEAVDDPLL